MHDQNTTDMSIRPMSAGWTIIELIMVIIIISILASIAIGKLSTTRDDAKLSASVSNMGVCITDVSAYFVASGQDYNTTNHPLSCDQNNTECYDIVYAINGINFNVSTNSIRQNYCEDIENVGGHLAKRYDFGGSTIKK